MASRKPVIHGSDHLPGHADEIPGLTIGSSGIQYGIENTGTYLHVDASAGMVFSATDDIGFVLSGTGNDYSVTSDNLTLNTSAGATGQMLLHGQLVQVHAENQLQLYGDKSGPGDGVVLQASTGGMAITVISGNLLQYASGSIKLTMGSFGAYGATPVSQPTGVAVSSAGIHAALVSLGWITA